MKERGRLLDAIESMPGWMIVAAIILLHVVLTVWQAWTVQINDDGIMYARAARLFAEGRFTEGRAVYSWHYFPLLIGTISSITTLDPLIAGKLVNLLASTATLILLLRMSWMQIPSKTTMCAVAVLIFGNYAWNDARSALTRDQMFFCFVILSFFLLLLDQRTSRIAYKLGFVAACICASLARKEAAALLVLVPALLIASGPYPRALRVAAIAVLVVAIAAIILIMPYEMNGRVAKNMFFRPLEKIAILHDQVLWPFASRRAYLAYAAIVTGLVIASTISALSPLSMAFTGWGLLKSPSFRKLSFIRLFACFFAASMVALSVQTFLNLVFEVRYGLFLGLLLTVPAALAATTLVPSSVFRVRWVAIPVTVIVAWLVYGLVGGLRISDASRFHLEAGAWLRSNVAPDAISLSNNNQIAFYGNLAPKDADADFFLRSISGRENISALRKWSDYDVVVIRLRKDQLDQVAGLDAAIGKSPTTQFENARGDKILIYQPRKPPP